LIFFKRYGEDASILTENAAYAVGNAALTAYYVGGIGPKSVRIQQKDKNWFHSICSIFLDCTKSC
jgi:hypothetical protein